MDKQNKIYFEGLSDGSAIKIGKTGNTTDKRRGQRTNNYYAQKAGLSELLLAAVQTDASAERHLHRHFGHLHERNEYFTATPELTEYVYWLRNQHFTWLCDEVGPDEIVGYEAFAPREERRKPIPEPVGDTLINEWHLLEPMPFTTDLRNTAWAAMSIIKPTFNDYYTPLWMVDMAREGMGGIDLDPASSYSANYYHKIPKFYSRQDDGHTQPWFGRVWLNAPYGENKPWIDDVIRHWDSGAVTQLCWLAPTYAFNKKQALPLRERASLVIQLTVPTDTMFWGWGKRTDKREETFCMPGSPSLGTNQSHTIMYFGDRWHEMAEAFQKVGFATVPLRVGVAAAI